MVTSRDALFEVESGLVVWESVSFGLLLLILFRFAWKPVRDYLREREGAIRDTMQAAARAVEECVSVRGDLESRADAQRLYMSSVLISAKAAAGEISKKLLNEAEEMCGRISANTNAEIEAMKHRAIVALRAELAEMVVRSTDVLVSQLLDEPRQVKLINTSISKLMDRTDESRPVSEHDIQTQPKGASTI